MVTVVGWRIIAQSWTNWALKPYANQGSFQDGVAKMFWVSLLSIFSNFSYFLVCCTILILSYTQEHFHLAEGVSLESANIVFNKVAWKVLQDAIKLAHLVSTATYYSHVLYHLL
jgi:hypothetical protein